MPRAYGTREDFRPRTVGTASACPTQLLQYEYQEIRQILEHGDDAYFLSKDDIDDEVPVTSIHKNIRGAAYFSQLKHLNRDNNGNK